MKKIKQRTYQSVGEWQERAAQIRGSGALWVLPQPLRGRKASLEELQSARNNYEALNAQLLDELPKFHQYAQGLFSNCVHGYAEAHCDFVRQALEQLKPLLSVRPSLPMEEGTPRFPPSFFGNTCQGCQAIIKLGRLTMSLGSSPWGTGILDALTVLEIPWP